MPPFVVIFAEPVLQNFVEFYTVSWWIQVELLIIS